MTHRTRLLRALPAAGALLALLATACTVEAEVGEVDTGPRQQVQQMLTARADALASGDVDTYLEPLDPPAREVEQPIAEQAVDMPLADIRLLLGEATFLPGEAGTTRVNDAKVDFAFDYEGVPEDNTFWFRLLYDLEGRDGAWRVTEVELVIPDMDLPVPMPPMWALGPAEVARSEHFLALHRPDLDDPQRSLDLAEEARTQLLPQLTLTTAPTHVIQLAATSQQYQELLDPSVAARSVAVANYLFDGTAYAPSRNPTNRHMTVNLEVVFGPARTGEDGEEGHGHGFEPEVTPRQVFQHELAHLALSRFTRPSTPVWVVEGGAMQLAGEQRVRSWRAGLEAGVFEEMDFRRLARRDPGMGLRAIEYAYVNAAVSALVEAEGTETFWGFYQNFKDFHADMGGGTPLEQVHGDGTRRLLRRIYDIDEDDLEERALEWIRTHAE